MTPDSTLISPHLVDRARQVRLLVLDVDGVLSDGRLYYQADGQETKTFYIHDGHGLKLLRQAGLEVALITGRNSPIVSRRAAELGIEHLEQGREDKLDALRQLCQHLGLELAHVAYCGDDLPDLPAIRRAGLGISVPNAPSYVRAHADWITTQPGGHGAVREICDALLDVQGHWGAVIDTYLHEKP